MDRKENVLVVCAHPDDETFGVGGTIARYVAEGKNITVIVFSYGEMSHVWIQKRHSIIMRKKEHQKAKKVLGYKTSIVLGIKEGTFEGEKFRIEEEIKRIMEKAKPSKIFTHNIHDPHPDHKAVNKIVMDVCHNLDYKGEIYMFDVWNVLNFRRMAYPMLYVDITSNFKKKLDALACFRSQWSSMIGLLWNVYSNAIIHGISHRTRFAERFFKAK